MSAGLRVLLVNQYFPPDTSATAAIAADVVRALVAAGHQVRVLAGRPSYRPTERRPWRWRRSEAWQGARVVRVGSTAFDRARLAGRALNYLSYLALAHHAARRECCDVVLAMTDPPLAVIAAERAARAAGVPLVYNVRDLHPEMALASGILRPGPLAAWWARVHHRTMRRADRVIVLGDDMRDRVTGLGVSAERVVVVRDGAPPLPSPPPPGRLTAEIRGSARFVVVHAGNLGYAGAWDTLLAAADVLAGDGVAWTFVGDGAARRALQARTAGRPHVRWRDPVGVDDLPELLAAGDLQVVTVRQGLEGLVVPSRLYPLLAAGRPVLAVVPDGADAAGIVRRHGCGWVAAPDDPAAVVQAVREAAADRDARLARAERARAAAAEYARDRLLSQLVDVLAATARQERG